MENTLLVAKHSGCRTMPRDFQLGNHSRGTQIVCGLTPSQWPCTTWPCLSRTLGQPREEGEGRRGKGFQVKSWSGGGIRLTGPGVDCLQALSDGFIAGPAQGELVPVQGLPGCSSCSDLSLVGPRSRKSVFCGWPPLCKPMTQKTVVGVMKEAPWLVPQTARGSSEPISQ